MNALGADVRRVDGPAKIRGWAQYTADIELPGMVYAKALRSIYPHARLVRVDASKAEKFPGVVAGLTRNDLKEKSAYYGPGVRDQPEVAMARARGVGWVGEVIGAVGAEGRDIGDEALGLMEGESEPLPAVFDPVEAMKPEAPILHKESARSEIRLDKDSFAFKSNTNVLNTYHVEEGDIAVGFRESDEIFEDVYTSQKIQ